MRYDVHVVEHAHGQHTAAQLCLVARCAHPFTVAARPVIKGGRTPASIVRTIRPRRLPGWGSGLGAGRAHGYRARVPDEITSTGDRAGDAAPPGLPADESPYTPAPTWTLEPRTPDGAAAWPPATPPLLPPPPRRLKGTRRRVLLALAVVVVSAAVGVAVVVNLPAPAHGRPSVATAPAPQLSGSPADSAAPSTQRQEQIDAVLETMTRALSAGDEGEFLSVVDPGSGALAARQRRVFRALRSVPLALVTYSWEHHRWFRLDQTTRTYGQDAVVALVVRRTLIDGFDTVPTAETLGLTFARRGSQWYLANDTDGDYRLWPFTQPWSVGPVHVTTREHVIVIGDVQHARDEARLASRVEAAALADRVLWPTTTWNGKVVVLAATDKRFVDTWFGEHAMFDRRNRTTDPGEPDHFVDFMPTNEIDSDFDPLEPGPPRILVSPGFLTSQGPWSDRALMHDVAHLATAGMTKGEPATWVVEGIAEYSVFHGGPGVHGAQAVAARGVEPGLWKTIKQGSYTPRLVADAETFFGYDGATSLEVGTNFTSAWFACLFIADHYGQSTLRRFVDVVYSTPSSRSPDVSEAEATAFSAVLHTTRARFVKDVAAYARSLRAGFP